MLFRYELHDDAVGPAPRFRWLKKMFIVPVYPSLTLSASVSPAFSAKNEQILSLECTNCRTDRPDQLELDLDQLTMASRHYRLEPLSGQMNLSSSVTLGWQERVTFHYKLIRNEQENAPLLSHCPFSVSEGGGGPPKSTTCLLDFLCLERAHENFEGAMKLHQMALARAAAMGEEGHQPRSIASIRRANTGELSFAESAYSESGELLDRTGHCTSIAALCPQEETGASVHIICSWKGPNLSFRGSHHIRGLAVRPSSGSRECPITLTASHPSSVSNNFDNGPANVPLRVTLKNRVDTPVDLEFAIVTPVTFDFSGPESYKTKLGGGEELSIPMRALLPAAGVYNLQRVRLTVANGDSASYRFPLQWMVTANAV